MILFESCYGFGDCLMNIPLIKAYSECKNHSVHIATRNANKDAFENLDFIEKIHPITKLNEGKELAKKINLPYQQLTQHYWWKRINQQSLMDIPSIVGKRKFDLIFPNQPIIIPTEEEISATEDLRSTIPLIAIEADCNSNQSWVKDKSDIFEKLLSQIMPTPYKILWLSKTKPIPEFMQKLDYVDDMHRFTRRECVAALRHCELLISTNSGFFVAAMALKNNMQPQQVLSLLSSRSERGYKIHEKILQYGWHKNLKWAFNESELGNSIEFFAKNLHKG